MDCKPTQRDRDAAATWAKMQGRAQQAANMRRGSCDTAPLVKLIARHAAAERALERAAIVEWLRTDDRFKPYDGAEKSFAFTAALSAAIEAGEHLSDIAEAIARGE